MRALYKGRIDIIPYLNFVVAYLTTGEGLACTQHPTVHPWELAMCPTFTAV
jgi:hypothetical protein